MNYESMPTYEGWIDKARYTEWRKELRRRRALQHKCPNRKKWAKYTYVYLKGVIEEDKPVIHMDARVWFTNKGPNKGPQPAPVESPITYCPFCGIDVTKEVAK